MSAHDSQELQDLFDSVARQQPAAPSASPASTEASGDDSANLFQSIGLLVRKLHDALHEAGEPNLLSRAQATLPESRERLSFIGDLMEKSASECIALSEREMPLLEANADELARAKAGWDKVVSGHSNVEEFKSLALALPSLLERAATSQQNSKAAFMQILMAQGFQDLAGQTLGKIIKQVGDLERDLLELMALAAVEPGRKERLSEFLEGPQYSKNDDAVQSQQEVDDLLKDLGF